MSVGVGLDENPNNWHTFILSTSHILLFCEDFQIYFKWATPSNYPPSGCLEDPFWCESVQAENSQTFSVSRFQISTHQFLHAVPQEFRMSQKWVGIESLSGWAPISILSKWAIECGEEVMWINAVKQEMDHKNIVCQVRFCIPATHPPLFIRQTWSMVFRKRKPNWVTNIKHFRLILASLQVLSIFYFTWQSLQNLAE